MRNENEIRGGTAALLRQIGRAAVDALYPPRCPVCGEILKDRRAMICPQCARNLPYIRGMRCMKCGRPVRAFETEYCADCRMYPHRFEEGRSALVYEKGARRSLDRLKFHNRREYVPFFGTLLAALAAEAFPMWRPDCLVPVPMHRRKRARRGFDQAALLAAELGRRTGTPVREDLLVRTRYTQASKRLGRAGRRKNLRGVFAVNEKAPVPERAVLIDDIYTTGATMDEAASALRRAGVEYVFFLTVCTGRGDA